jgi:PAS domain S-box-containing protein
MAEDRNKSTIIEEIGDSPDIRLNHLIKVTAECNHSMIRFKDLPALMQNICQILVNEGGFTFAWILLLPDLSEKKASVLPQFQVGLTENEFQIFSSKVSTLLNDYLYEKSNSHINEPSIIRRAKLSRNQKKLFPRANEKKYASVIILRLFHLQKFLGLIAIYSAIENFFNENEIAILRDFASDLSCGISSIKTKDELKATQEALSESQNMLQLVMDTIPIRLFWKDKNFRYLGCNKAFAIDAGLNSPEEIVGMNDFELSWKETAPLYRSDDTEIFSKNISKINYEEPQVRDDGTTLWLRTTKIPLQNQEGEIIGLFGSYEDITERKKAEENLKENERRYKMATNAASVGVWDLDFRTRKMYIDPILKALLGYKKSEISNRIDEWEKMIHPEDFNRVSQQTRAYIQGMAPKFEMNYRMYHRDGSIRWFNVRGTVLKDARGNPSRMLGTNTDITTQMKLEAERENMRAQLLQAQKMEAVGTLAGGMAHDFNNLLTTIKGYSDISITILDDKDPIFKNLQQIQKTVVRASALTNQLLIFSRKQLMIPAAININETIKNMLMLLDRVIGENIQIQTNFQTDIWKIWADEGNIEQVIMNLTVNSRDAMPQGGNIKIKTQNIIIKEADLSRIPESRPGQFVYLTFSDSGIGMSDQIIKHVFEPFFTTKEVGKGTGLGLSVIYGIISQHKGWITVESQKGKVTTFHIYFPASFSKPEAELESEKILESLNGEGEAILLVEDEEGIREFLVELLEDRGYRVFARSTVKEALLCFKKEKDEIKLILTDVVLPDRSGLQLVETVKKQKPDIHVILTSGYTREKSNLKLILKKGYRFLKKPFTVSDLLAGIAKELGKV